VYHAYDGVGEDQGEEKAVHAKSCASCLNIRRIGERRRESKEDRYVRWH